MKATKANLWVKIAIVKQQILKYKTVYRLVNGGITHQKPQISEKGDSVRQYKAYIDTCIAT